MRASMTIPEATGSDLMTLVDEWLAGLEDALTRADGEALAVLFHAQSYWRDVLSFTWTITTVSGARPIAAALLSQATRVRPSGLRADRARAEPAPVTRAGTDAIEAIFTFDTAEGRGEGVVRLMPDANVLKAWTLLTALDSLTGFEEQVGDARPSGDAYSRDFRGSNWLDQRTDAVAYRDRDPAVIVVGAGQAGLSIAARLTQLGVDTLIVDRHDRVGDNWRRRYHALTLHNQVQVNHLPYLSFPPNWPTYIPKDKLANWFEFYADAMELNVWTGTEFTGGEYDADSRRWSVRLTQSGGTVRELEARHIVMATGLSGSPHVPEIPTLESFAGCVLHSHDYDDAGSWGGKSAIVVGTGNSGHDIAQDLCSNGASVTLVQRNPTMIVSVEPSAQLPYALYDEGSSLEDCDLVVTSMPFAVARKAHKQMTAKAKELDTELLGRLTDRGFKLDFGEDGTGWQFKYLTRGGGYYFNVGCSDMIADGDIRLIQFDEIDRFEPAGALLGNGETLAAELIVLATGYEGQAELARRLFGDTVADRVGSIWGFSEDDELSNMFTRTAQPGLWFIAGSFAQCRIFSKYLALQLKACEEGLIPAQLHAAQLVDTGETT